jgi:hypothetical protein
MMKTKLAICAVAVAGLLAAPLAAEAKSQKHYKHPSTTTGASTTTTGANMKTNRSSGSAAPSSQGNIGPGTNNNMGPAPGAR